MRDEFNVLLTSLKKYLSEADLALVQRAYIRADQAHASQVRKTGEPFVLHPIGVARVLADMRMDVSTICAALLHDVLEDTATTKSELQAEFGPVVADLVDGVSKLTHMPIHSQEELQAENLRKMILAMAKDIRVIVIKLADRLHNLQTIHALPTEKRRRKALETLEIYAPLAARLGMHQLKLQLEDLGFAALYPMRYRTLKKAQESGFRKEMVQGIETQFNAALKTAGVSVSVLPRDKPHYSLYYKMKQKGIRLAEAMDVISFRLIADSIDDCYRALGLVHAAYKPLPKRFKDYIAVPKANGYQSLHTVLAGPHGIPIEVQIRTQWMDHVAESGIAAHWLYQSTDVSNASKEAQQACAWVDELVGIRDAVDTTREYLDQVKFDLEPSEVYVFTPKGKIFALPFGATAVDFAYLVHTDIGHRCESARIDRRMSPLSTRLSSGQTIEIITTADAVPNPAWLNFVVTAKARTSIREWLRRQKAEQAQKLGQKLLEAALASVGVSPTSLTPEHIATACRHAHVASYAALVEAIGLGQQFAALVAPHFLPQQSVDALPVVKPSLVIEGTEGIVVHYATCCYPIPGDAVVGFLTGEGLLVHQESCAHIEQRLNTPEKCVFLSWADQVVGEFPVEVRFDLDNSPGALALVTTIIAEANANIIAVRLDEKERHYSSVMLVMTVHNRYHLSKIIRRLRNNTVVSRIIRT